MGAAFSCLPRYGWCVPKHSSSEEQRNYTSTPRRQLRGHRCNLSAAFNMADLEHETNVEAVNINTSTEEELMTLPGINRQTAHNIVEYRMQIGGFKKVEDLALVSGVGATKLGLLRTEVCVSTTKKTSLNSSPNSSHQDVGQDDTSRSSAKSQNLGAPSNKPLARVNVNTSNVFQLMRVKGITQCLAEQIVMYRDKKGHFKNLDDLVKVKGIRPGLLSAIRPHLSLHDVANGHHHTSQNHVNTSQNSASSHANHARKASSAQESINSTLYPNMVDFSVSSKRQDSQEDLCSLYGPLGRRSIRSKSNRTTSLSDRERMELDSGGIRVASWNLQQCSLEKVDNPGVKEVFAMTLLENDVSIIAVQELKDEFSLDKLCDELNNPTVPNVRKWPSSRGVWKCVTSPEPVLSAQGPEHLGFAWDSSRGITLESCDLLDKSRDPESRDACTSGVARPFIASFHLPHYNLTCVNLHQTRSNRQTPTSGLNSSHVDSNLVNEISTLLQTVKSRQNLASGGHVMLLASCCGPVSSTALCRLGDQGLTAAFHGDQYTDVSSRQPEGCANMDNICVEDRSLCTGVTHIVREGLTSPWIPDGWAWGGLISDRCPLFVEVRAHPLDSTSTHVQTAARRVEDMSIALRLAAGGNL